MDAPSSTWFTAAPHWRWYIVMYFFLGGLAGGSYFLAALIDLFGGPEDRPLARLGYYVAFPLVVAQRPAADRRPRAAAALLAHADREQHLSADVQVLVADVDRLVGADALRVASAFLSFLAALAEDERAPRGRGFARLRVAGVPRSARRRRSAVIAVARRHRRLLRRRLHRRPAGGHQPADLVRHAAARHAVRRLGRVDVGGADDPAGASIGLDDAGPVADLHRMDDWVIVLELLVLVAVMVSLGPVLRRG